MPPRIKRCNVFENNPALQVSYKRRTLSRCLWSIPAIMAAFLGMSNFWWFTPNGIRAAADELMPKATEELHDEATRVEDPDGFFGIKGTLKLADGGVLDFRYSEISDSGVQIQRLNRQGGIVWSEECAPLGVMHSEYYHKAFVFIEGETIRVVSQGSRGMFVERLALDSGKRIARSIKCDSYGDPPQCIPYYPFP